MESRKGVFDKDSVKSQIKELLKDASIHETFTILKEVISERY
jgi:hypothetical protein